MKFLNLAIGETGDCAHQKCRAPPWMFCRQAESGTATGKMVGVGFIRAGKSMNFPAKMIYVLMVFHMLIH